jgi:hypothetical protein
VNTVSPKISEKFEMTLMLFPGAWGKMSHEKLEAKKSCDTVKVGKNCVFAYLKSKCKI